MPRIPYLDENDIVASPKFLQTMKNRRPNGQLLNLDRILLYSEPVAKGWHQLFSKLRQDLSFAAKYRELAILRIAIVNRAPYEFSQHEPEAIKAGISQAQINALANWRVSELFDDTEQVVLAYADAMSQSIQIPDPIYKILASHFNEQQIVELTALIAGYNMVSRFLEALQITIKGE